MKSMWKVLGSISSENLSPRYWIFALVTHYLKPFKCSDKNANFLEDKVVQFINSIVKSGRYIRQFSLPWGPDLVRKAALGGWAWTDQQVSPHQPLFRLYWPGHRIKTRRNGANKDKESRRKGKGHLLQGNASLRQHGFAESWSYVVRMVLQSIMHLFLLICWGQIFTTISSWGCDSGFTSGEPSLPT